MNSDTELTLTVRFHASKERAADLESALAELAVASRKDAGCLRYDLFRCGAGEVLLLEHWSSRAQLEAHQAQPHVARFRVRAGELFCAPPDLLEWEAFDLTATPLEGQ